MSQQLLCHFGIIVVLLDQSRVGSSHSVPPDVLGDAQALGHGFDLMRHHPCQPVGLFALFCRTREHIIAILRTGSHDAKAQDR